MRPILIPFIWLVLAPAAWAGCRGPEGLPPPSTALAPVEGEFRAVPDKGLGCVLSPQQGQAMAQHEQALTFLPCLRIGAVAIADDRKAVEGLLGGPQASTDLDLFTESRVYEVAQRGQLRPHYVVTYRDDKVVAVQLVGPPMMIPAYFSGLTLGDDQQRVIDTLGWPTQRCRNSDRTPELWRWDPFPFAIDMIDGSVAGFKVTWPGR